MLVKTLNETHIKLIAPNFLDTPEVKNMDFWDNAVAESFFHTLKIELVHHCDFETREEARAEIFEYIEVFYNRQRLHSSNGYEAPLTFEMMQEAV